MIVSYSGPRHQVLCAIRQRSIEAAGQCCECDILTNSAWLIEFCALSAHKLWGISRGYAELFCCFELSRVFFRWHSFSATVSHFSSIFSDRIPACHNCNCRAGSMAETSDSRVLSVSETLLEAWPQKDRVGMRKTVDGSLHVIAFPSATFQTRDATQGSAKKRPVSWQSMLHVTCHPAETPARFYWENQLSDVGSKILCDS